MQRQGQAPRSFDPFICLRATNIVRESSSAAKREVLPVRGPIKPGTRPTAPARTFILARTDRAFCRMPALAFDATWILAALALLVAGGLAWQAHTLRQLKRSQARDADTHQRTVERQALAVQHASARSRDATTRDALLAGHARIGTFEWSLDTDALAVSEHWARMLGSAAVQPATMQALRLQLHPIDLDRYDEALQRALAGKRELDLELRVQAGEGWHWLHLVGAAVPAAHDDEPVDRLIGHFFDVHAAKLAEEALAFERRLFGRGPVVVVSLDAAAPHCLRAASASAWNALLGRPLGELLDDADAPAVLERIAAVAGQAGATFEIEARLKLPDGETRWHSLHAMVTGAEGRLLRAYLVDVERLKRAEQEAAGQARHLERLLSESSRSRREAETLKELSELMQAALSEDQACALVAERGERLFAGWQGSVYLADALGQLQRRSHWGEAGGSELLDPNDCWGMRRRRPHAGQPNQGVAQCSHFGAEPPLRSLCLPMAGLTTGSALLQLETRHAEAAADVRFERLAVDFAEAVRLSLTNVQLRLSLQEQATRDWMTGLHNRRYFEERLPLEIDRAARTGEPLVLAILDIDHFKAFNDRYGHDAGDAVIRHTARALAAFGRPYDLRCRLGGEELGLLMPRTTIDEAVSRLEGLRLAVKGATVEHGGQQLPPVTVSIGVAQASGPDGEQLVHRADLALYDAKHAGRARIAPWALAEPQA